jgi:hypothetical protein
MELVNKLVTVISMEHLSKRFISTWYTTNCFHSHVTSEWLESTGKIHVLLKAQMKAGGRKMVTKSQNYQLSNSVTRCKPGSWMYSIVWGQIYTQDILRRDVRKVSFLVQMRLRVQICALTGCSASTISLSPYQITSSEIEYVSFLEFSRHVCSHTHT